MSGDDDYDDDLEFGHCGNIGCEDGWVADCFDGFCINAEDGCALCMRRCDWCNPAQAGEAGTAETTEIGSVHEHAVPEGNAP